MTLSEHVMSPLADGVFELELPGVGHGALYRFVVDGRALPDPYARFLPRGVHGPAMVVENRFAFRSECVSRPLDEQVLYELHVGTFTPEGTYASAGARLEALAELGVTTLELLPVAAFDGARGWGYDGVAHYAPFAPYGTPGELRAFVDRAHELGLAVLLDVVYNHFGPSGNYLAAYDARYFTRDSPSPWGDAPNFEFFAMRRYVIDNARYWLDEFRFDGLRLDATHALFDPSPRHVLEELAAEVARLEPKRVLIAEDDRNDAGLVVRSGIDALWADDFHHALRVTLTGEQEGYFAAYSPGASGVARTIQRGFLYEGQLNPVSGRPRGKPADELSAPSFVYCIQNHDQVGNRALGDRLNHAVSVEAYLAASLVLLFLPMTPLLFMGQEWASSSPFLYFTDHEAELGQKITEGRRREFAGFDAFTAAGSTVPDPQALETFVRSKLDWNERAAGEHARVLDFHRALLELRRNDPVLRVASREHLRSEALGELLVVERFHDDEARVLLVNFGGDVVRADDVPAVRELTEPRVLVANAPELALRSFPPYGALVLAGRGIRRRA